MLVSYALPDSVYEAKRSSRVWYYQANEFPLLLNISPEYMWLLELRTSFHTGFQRFGGLVKLLFCAYSADGNAAFWMLVSIRMMLSIFSDRCMWRVWHHFHTEGCHTGHWMHESWYHPHGYQVMMTHPNRDTKREEEILKPAFSHHCGKKANSDTNSRVLWRHHCTE